MTLKLKLKPRRIVKINYSDLVTLPKVWLDINNLNDGGMVNLEIIDNNLVISSLKNKK